MCIVRPEDTARLEISDDWGATWRLLGSWNWNDADGEQGPVNWRDGAADSTDWVGEELPLGTWAGSPVQVRFVFESEIYGVARGWFVDALRIEPRAPSPPARFALRLLPGVPNPFNPMTRLRYEVSHPVRVMLRVYDVRGRLLCTLFDGPQSAGLHEVVWRGEDGSGLALPSGVYVPELRAAGEARTTKLVRLD